MISYKPFQKLLIDNEIKVTVLMKELNISSVTMATLNARTKNNKPVSLSTIEKICMKLNCKISDVVEIK